MSMFPLKKPTNSKNRHSRVKSRDRGFALVLVLWVLSLLTIMAGSFALTMRRESTIVAGIKDNAGAIAAAEAGVAYAEMMLLHPEQNKKWRADGNIYQVGFGSTKIRLRLLSESGKIDINNANQALLQSIFAQAQLDEEKQAKLIGAILDWRDQDDLLNMDGAEKKEYQDAGLKYQPRNKPFQSLEELQMVLGMDERLYNWLESFITVYAGRQGIDLKLASAQVLSLIPGLDTSLIETYVATRLESTKNDLPAPEFPASAIRGASSGANEVVTIVSDALMADETNALVVATVTKSGIGQSGALEEDGNNAAPFKVLKWQRNPSNEKSLFTDEMSELLVKKYAETELSD
jgi:general secretion pathway protein K